MNDTTKKLSLEFLLNTQEKKKVLTTIEEPKTPTKRIETKPTISITHTTPKKNQKNLHAYSGDKKKKKKDSSEVTVTYNTGKWSKEETERFIQGYEEVGRRWTDISERYVKTRNPIQVTSFSQKFFREKGLPNLTPNTQPHYNDFIAYGPYEPIHTENWCSPQIFQNVYNITPPKLHSEYCEEIFCDEKKSGIVKNKTLNIQRMTFVYCHMCVDIMSNNTIFVEKVKNESCSLSNEIYKPYKKCGDKIDISKDIVPYVGFYGDEEILDRLVAFYDFSTRILLPIASYSYQFFIMFYFSLFTLLVLTIQIPGEYKQIHRFRRLFETKDKIRFIFSIKNQIIVEALISGIVPAILGFISNFIKTSVHTYGVIVSQIMVFMQFFQIITLWAFFFAKSKNLSLKTLTGRQLSFLIGSYIALLVLGIIGGILFLLRSIFLDDFIPMMTLTSLIGLWLICVSIIIIVVCVILWILTLVVYRALSNLSSDTKEKANYFINLKLTKMAIFLNIAVFIDILFVFIYGVVLVLPVVSWAITMFVQYLMYFAILGHMMIIFLSMTKWGRCIQLYCCFLPMFRKKLFTSNEEDEL
eukprot:gene6945-11107_t